MTRNLLRLAALVFVLATTLGLTLPRPALAVIFICGMGNGDYVVNCTQTCCGPGVTTIYSSVTGFGSSCSAAKSECATCATCPAGQTRCGNTFGNCMF